MNTTVMTREKFTADDTFFLDVGDDGDREQASPEQERVLCKLDKLVRLGMTMKLGESYPELDDACQIAIAKAYNIFIGGKYNKENPQSTINAVVRIVAKKVATKRAKEIGMVAYRGDGEPLTPDELSEEDVCHEPGGKRNRTKLYAGIMDAALPYQWASLCFFYDAYAPTQARRIVAAVKDILCGMRLLIPPAPAIKIIFWLDEEGQELRTKLLRIDSLSADQLRRVEERRRPYERHIHLAIQSLIPCVQNMSESEKETLFKRALFITIKSQGNAVNQLYRAWCREGFVLPREITKREFKLTFEKLSLATGRFFYDYFSWTDKELEKWTGLNSIAKSKQLGRKAKTKPVWPSWHVAGRYQPGTS